MAQNKCASYKLCVAFNGIANASTKSGSVRRKRERKSVKKKVGLFARVVRQGILTKRVHLHNQSLFVTSNTAAEQGQKPVFWGWGVTAYLFLRKHLWII